MAIGIVDLAEPTLMDVMPWHLARAFRRSETHFVYRNVYANGEVSALAATQVSRKTWELDLGLTAGQLWELREYFESHMGSMIPFYFYDVGETVDWFYPYGGRYDIALYNVDIYFQGGDATSLVTGRYCVRFDCAYDATMGLGALRGQVPIRLIELASDPAATFEEPK